MTSIIDFTTRLAVRGITALFLGLMLIPLHGQQPEPSPVKIYIMAGQSNMVGHGDISPVGTQGTLEYIVANDPGTNYQFLVDGLGDWIVRDDVWFIDEAKATSGLTTGLGANAGRIGPELGFGHKIGDHHGNQVLIIDAAWGGKSLAVDFRPPSSGGETGYYYNLLTNAIDDSVANLSTYFPDYNGQGYEFSGFCWHQGYNDRISETYSAEYQTNMANFINDIRAHVNVPDMPFVIATTGMGGGTETTVVEDAQLEMANAATYPDFAGNVSVIDTRNTTYLGQAYQQDVANSPASEGHHWNRNAMTYLHIGMAMGDAMAALPGPECPSRLGAVGDASGVTLTWQNGSEMPTSVQILRNGVEIEAAAPVSPATYLDASAAPGVHNYELVFTMPTAACDPLTITFDAGITELVGYRGSTGVELEWVNNLGYTNIEVRRDNVLLTTLSGTDTSYTDTTAPSTGSFTYSVVPTNGTAAETEVIVDLGPPSAGDAFIYEPFDYAIGDLDTQAGSSETGLDGVWDAKDTVSVVPGSLTYSTLPTFGASIGDFPSGNNHYGGARAISASALSSSGYLNDGATLWFSAVVGLDTGGNATNSRLSFALANDQFSAGNYDHWIVDDGPQLGEGIGIFFVGNGGRANAAHFRDLASGDGVSGIVQGAWDNSAGTTYQSGEYGLIVGKIVWGAGATDTIEIYQPAEDMLLPADPSSALTNVDVDQAAFDTITFARGDKVVLDEIRFGPSYESVTSDTSAPDTTDPTLAPGDIVDDVSGGPVTSGITVNYTLTFSEDMDSGTVDGSDFSNAGTAAVTIGTVSETIPGTFTVEVTPTTTGTLQLQIPMGATLQDLSGNSLDTSSAILDDTTITVNAPDITGPMISGSDFVDDQSGGPIYTGTLVTYTLTFSEELNDTTIDSSDFANAGTASVTFGAVTQSSPGIVTVEVTPTTTGSLELEISMGAVIEDPSGNGLDTASAIVDDTSITVEEAPVPTTLVYEPFDYSAGDLNGQNGGTGFDGAWSANGTTKVASPGLSYGTLFTSGNTLGGLSASQNRYVGSRGVSTGLAGMLDDGDELWFSVIMGYDGGNATNTTLAFALSTGQFTGGNYSYQISGAAGDNGFGVFMGRLDNGSNTANYRLAVAQFRDSTTYSGGFSGVVYGDVTNTDLDTAPQLVVGKFTWGATEDTLELYLPDTDLNLGPVVSALTINIDQTQYDTITAERGDKVVMDEIRFGVSSDSVLGLGGGGPSDTFADWIATYPGVGGLTGLNDDADGDGNGNGIENFFGTDPSAYSGGLVSGVFSPGTGTFTFTHPQSGTLASDLTATYRWSTDLATFTNDGDSAGGTTVDFSAQLDTPVVGTTTVTATVTGVPLDKLFIDVEVTQTP